MDYMQYVETRIGQMEELLGYIRSGKLFWCETCECWVPIDEKRQDPWGGEWPVCEECLADCGLEDSLVSENEYKEHLADSAMEAAERTRMRKQNNAKHRHN
jgi:hypothetical protein